MLPPRPPCRRRRPFERGRRQAQRQPVALADPGGTWQAQRERAAIGEARMDERVGAQGLHEVHRDLGVGVRRARRELDMLIKHEKSGQGVLGRLFGR